MQLGGQGRPDPEKHDRSILEIGPVAGLSLLMLILIVGGLLVCTCFTLFVVPTVYSLLAAKKEVVITESNAC